MSGYLIGGTVTCTNRSDAFLQKLGDALGEALEECGEHLVGVAQEACPVDSGALRSTIRFTIVDDRKVRVSAGGESTTPTRHSRNPNYVDYADAVEFGTSRTPAQPFLQPAVLNHTAELKAIMDSHLT